MAAEKNLDCNKLNCFSSTARLFNLIRDGENELAIQTLLQEGVVDIEAKDSDGNTPLLLATRYRRKNIAKLIIDYGANVNCIDNAKGTVLHFASRLGSEWLEIVQHVVKRIPDIDVRDSLGQTPLHHAAYFGSLEIAKCFVEGGADVNAGVNVSRSTPLVLAAVTGQREVVDLLLHFGAKVDICNAYTHNALHCAAFFGWAEIVKSLVKRVSDLDVGDFNGHTALHLASASGQLQIVKCLLEEKVDINAKSKKGKTALLLSCEKQKLDVVEYLFQANASCDIADIYGNSPLHYLIKMERPSVKIIKLFIEKTANLLLADYDAILNSSLMKVAILQDVEFCCDIIVNKYNNQDLPELYKSPVAGSLPHIKNMKIATKTEVFQTIERKVRFEIQKKGHCNMFNVRPKVLQLLCVTSILKYYDKL